MVVGWSGCARSQFFMVCWKRSTFPQVVGWLGREFFWITPSLRSSCSNPLRVPAPTLAAGQTGRERHAVVGQGGGRNLERETDHATW
jgi:hypothetical protein